MEMRCLDAVGIQAPHLYSESIKSFCVNGMDTTISFLLYGESDALVANNMLSQPLSHGKGFRTLIQQR